jgi:hypothetical protein
MYLHFYNFLEDDNNTISAVGDALLTQEPNI